MGLFNLFRKKYDMDSLDGINSIPVPAKNYNSGDPTKDCIYYLLQRKATEHKRNGRMDLAIACLKKSNALSDYESRPLLTQEEYMRLIKYLEYDKQFEEATKESERIAVMHPEFCDKRILNLAGIKKSIQKNKEWKNDLVIVSSNSSCPICKKYNRKVYSISGRNKKYPKIPNEIIKEGGFCKNCYIGLNSYFDGISTPTNA